MTGRAGLQSRQTNRKEPADKPGSVVDSHSSGTARHRAASSDLPESPFGERRCPRPKARTCSSYLVLLQAGFTVPRRVTTRAVRSYRTISPLPALTCLGGVFSVALSMGSRPPGVTWRLVRWSPDFPPAPRRAPATAWPTLTCSSDHYTCRCTQASAAALTGRRPHVHRAAEHRIQFRPGQPP